MTRIGLISDTHGYLDENVFEHFKNCDEVWHGGDWGEGIVERLKLLRSDGARQTVLKLRSDGARQTVLKLLRSDGGRQTVLRGVYGNIDGNEIRNEFPEQLIFMCEEVKVMIRHIGGYPPRYNPETKKELLIHQPQLFIAGHSHILKILYDDKLQCLHMNPGAAGKQGWHKTSTIIRFVIDGKNMKDCEVIELGKK